MAFSLLSSATALVMSSLAAFSFFIMTILAFRASRESQSASLQAGFLAGAPGTALAFLTSLTGAALAAGASSQIAFSLLSSSTALVMSSLAAFSFFMMTILALRASRAFQSASLQAGFLAGPPAAATGAALAST